MHTHNCFITLTYDDEQLPKHGSLHYRDFQLFLKRLRKHTGASGLRFYMCGEYGSNFGRPHYHACIFGHDFEDRYYWRTTSGGSKSYRSPTLEKLWTQGNSEIGTVTFESAAYIARYCVQKITGPMAKWAYGPCTPEFNQMSRGQGIGKSWLEKYLPDVYPNDYVIARGAKSKPPKYYDKHLAKIDPILLGQIKESREIDGTSRRDDNTQERLKAKETVAKAKSKLLKRSES